MKNKEVASLLYEIAELLTLSDENVFKVRAYERASQSIESLPEAIEEIVRRDELKEIPGIGESIAEKIKEYLSTGKIGYLEELKKCFPEGLLEIMSIPGMGPKKAKLLFNKLKISTVEELAGAARKGKLRDIAGFGAKTEENILKGIVLKEKSKGRILLNEALLISDEIVSQLKTNKYIRQIVPAGSLRRAKETIGDIDILCSVEKGKEDTVIKQFTHLPQVKRILAEGETKITVLTDSDMQVDLRIIEPDIFGAALQYFTGSKEHNVALRTLARQKGYTISEYGIFKIGKKEKPIAAKTEEDIYKILKMSYIPPRMRENRGEIDTALKHRIPKLVELKDIKGDVHVHSKYSDGANSISQIGDRARELGYEWIIITDHSQSLKVARGLSVSTLKQKIEEIRWYNEKSRDLKILCGTEVDILGDGSIDYPQNILEELDFVLAAIHTGFKQSEEQMTNRIVKALQNPFVDCVAHPSGRLINKRDAYAVNLEKVLEAAKNNNKLLEIDAFPERLDLNDIYCKKAKEMGIKLGIGTDSHTIEHLKYMELGIYIAQRGWLEKKDVINTLSYDELTKYLSKRRTMS